MAIPYSRTVFANIPWYSVLIVLGMLTAILLGEREQKRKGLPADSILDVVLWAIPSGIIGARLYYVLMRWDVFRHDPISILYIWEGGIAIYGGVIAGILAVIIYARKKKLSALSLLDCLVPGLLLAQAIGRWGNYFNMEAYGPEIKNTLFQFFPMGVLIPEGSGYVWHMATFFYESMWNLTGFLLLWSLRKKQQHDGAQLFWYFLWYASGRFVIEGLREDSLYLGPFRVSQLLSVVLCAAAIVWLCWKHARQEDRKDFFIALVGCLCLLVRWIFLDSTDVAPTVYVYVFVWLLALRSALQLCPGKKGLILSFLAIALIDLCAMAAPRIFPGSASFLMRLNAVVCSLTLPIFTALTVYALYTNDAAKEPDYAHRKTEE
ncbi:MAG: prolipoprotein diacylglyceryl transferase [Clostridiales bacterium]|nr:prolipoprotein diacylglyceryl transferase [Clostridiales bacterium]